MYRIIELDSLILCENLLIFKQLIPFKELMKLAFRSRAERMRWNEELFRVCWQKKVIMDESRRSQDAAMLVHNWLASLIGSWWEWRTFVQEGCSDKAWTHQIDANTVWKQLQPQALSDPLQRILCSSVDTITIHEKLRATRKTPHLSILVRHADF